MNKKGATLWIADTIPFFLIFGLILAIVGVSFLYWLTLIAANTTQVPDGLELSLSLNRILASPQCFMYIDESASPHPYVLDSEKFSQAQLDLCYSGLLEGNIAYRFTYSPKGSPSTTLQTNNWKASGQPEKRTTLIDIPSQYQNRRISADLIIELQNVPQ